MWLFGYLGIYEQSLTSPDRWTPVPALDVGDFGPSLGQPEEALFIFSGGRSGHAGCALFTSNQWQRLDGDFGAPTYGADEQTIYLPSRNGVFIRRQPGTLDLEHLESPAKELVNIAVADLAGNLWLGTSEGTLCYRPNRTPPRTIALVSTPEIPRSAPLPVSFQGRERFSNSDNPALFPLFLASGRTGVVAFYRVAGTVPRIAGIAAGETCFGGAGARRGRQRIRESRDRVLQHIAGAAAAADVVCPGGCGGDDPARLAGLADGSPTSGKLPSPIPPCARKSTIRRQTEEELELSRATWNSGSSNARQN